MLLDSFAWLPADILTCVYMLGSSLVEGAIKQPMPHIFLWRSSLPYRKEPSWSSTIGHKPGHVMQMQINRGDLLGKQPIRIFLFLHYWKECVPHFWAKQNPLENFPSGVMEKELLHWESLSLKNVSPKYLEAPCLCGEEILQTEIEKKQVDLREEETRLWQHCLNLNFLNLFCLCLN